MPDYEAEINESMDETISTIAVELANTQEIVPQDLARDAVIREQIYKEKALEGEKAEEGSNAGDGEKPDDGGNLNKADEKGFDAVKKAPEKKLTGKKSGTKKEGSERHNPRLPLMLLVTAVFFILLITGVMSFVMKKGVTSTYEYQIEQAKICQSQGDYEKMLEYARKATEIAANSSDARMLVAKAYAGLGRYDEERIVLEGLVITDPSFPEVYDQLIPMYEDAGEYEKIAEMLLSCPDQAVIEKYAGFQAAKPEFSIPGGQYNETISVKLLATGSGTIYYTVDGSKPDNKSSVYSMPIILESGKYRIRAIYENSYGIISEESSEEYKIEIEKESVMPEVLLPSGNYFTPEVIKVANPPEGYQIYYTDNGQDPGIESKVYKIPIPLPLGSSDYKFVLGDESGNVSEVVACHYQFSIELPLAGSQAENLLKQALVSAGILADNQGNIPGGGGVRKYDVLSVIESGGVNLYLLEETFVSEDGVSQKTGNYYAVDPSTGQSYQAHENESGAFSLGGL